MHHFEGEHGKNIFSEREGAQPLPRPNPHWGGGYNTPDPTPVGAFGAFIRVPSALDPTPHFWIRA